MNVALAFEYTIGPKVYNLGRVTYYAGEHGCHGHERDVRDLVTPSAIVCAVEHLCVVNHGSNVCVPMYEEIGTSVIVKMFMCEIE